MKSVLLSASGKNTISSQIVDLFQKTQPNTICVASAYLTYGGSKFLDELVKGSNVDTRTIVVGISGEVTQPNAIRFLKDRGWKIRLGESRQGIFHPKMLVVGDGYFNHEMQNPTGCYFGSANFTGPGLEKNTELGCTTTDNKLVHSVSNAFVDIWNSSKVFTEDLLTEYEKRYSQRIQTRSFQDLVELGGSDELTIKTAIKNSRSNPVLRQENCSTVWVGLESFTGDYDLQVEVPKRAKEVLKNMLGVSNDKVDFECADGQIRPMLYNYYSANGMARINVPNAVPLVDWVRENKQGALMITSVEGQLSIRIVRHNDLNIIKERSYGLGTWGSTSTRQYGWY